MPTGFINELDLYSPSSFSFSSSSFYPHCQKMNYQMKKTNPDQAEKERAGDICHLSRMLISFSVVLLTEATASCLCFDLF